MNLAFHSIKGQPFKYYFPLLLIFNYNMDTRFVGHAVCTYFIGFISYLFYFIFKTDSMPKESLFSSSILAGKQYLAMVKRSNCENI
jgi:hypothetical protein